jgi:hypothetical protein
VPVPHVRHTDPIASFTDGTGAPHITVLALGQLPQHTRVSLPVVPGGFRQVVPIGHMLPKPGHVRQVGSGIGAAHATVLAAAQLGQQVAGDPVHELPVVHPPVPVPGHTRQTLPPASSTSGISIPHMTDAAVGHCPQHTRSAGAVVPGGFTHDWPEIVHSVPTPVQSLQVRPRSSTESGIASPHVTVDAATQPGQQLRITQVDPDGQRVPSPGHVLDPIHESGMSVPQSTIGAGKHASVHAQTPSTQVCPDAHGPLHSPPHPSDAPHIASVGHMGIHSQSPVSGLHSSWGPAQVPLQNPPHPSGAPHAPPRSQRGTHTQVPAMQREGAIHAGSHPHVSMHVPLEQTSPGAHVTPKQGFVRHSPARQN